MAEPPRIKRYALVPDARDGEVTRFHLARRLERMEEVSARPPRRQAAGEPRAGNRPDFGGYTTP